MLWTEKQKVLFKTTDKTEHSLTLIRCKPVGLRAQDTGHTPDRQSRDTGCSLPRRGPHTFPGEDGTASAPRITQLHAVSGDLIQGSRCLSKFPRKLFPEPCFHPSGNSPQTHCGGFSGIPSECLAAPPMSKSRSRNPWGHPQHS